MNPKKIMNKIRVYRASAILLLIFLILAFFVYTLKKDTSRFTTLDESTNYILTKEYSSNQKLYLEDQYLQYDLENNLHSRGFITFENRLVPFSFLGTPIFYGPFYLFLQDNLKIINLFFIFISLVCALTILRTISVNKKFSAQWVLIAFFSSLPVIYFFLKPFHNVVPSISFYLLFVLFILKFDRDRLLRNLYLAVLFSLICIWFRYEYILFVVLFLILNFIKERKTYLSIKNKLKHSLIIILIGFVVFVIPLMVINYHLYGNPLTYGYSLFTKTYFEGERTGSLSREIVNIFFPSQSFSFEFLKNNLLTLLLVSPVFFLAVFLVVTKDKNYRKIGIYWILIIYIVIYSGTSDTFLSGSDAITVNKAILRYWMILNFSAILLVALFLQNNYLPKNIKILFIVLLLVHSSIFLSNELIFEKNILDRYNRIYTGLIGKVDRTPYLLTAKDDKFIVDIAKPIVWQCTTWNELECVSKIDYQGLSELIKKLIENGEEVYVRKEGFFSDRLLTNFEEYGVVFEGFDENFHKAILVEEQMS